MKFGGTQWNLVELSGSGIPVGLNEIQWNSVELSGSGTSVALSGAQWDSVGLNGIRWNMVGRNVTQWNSVELGGAHMLTKIRTGLILELVLELLRLSLWYTDR